MGSPEMKSFTRQQWNRWLVGLSAIGCLLAGVFWRGEGTAQGEIWRGSFVRAGLLLGAFWLGMPTRGRAAAWANVSPWWIAGAILLVLVIIRRPWIFIPFVAVLLFLGVIVPLLTRKSR
jgi:hypothetical protein